MEFSTKPAPIEYYVDPEMDEDEIKIDLVQSPSPSQPIKITLDATCDDCSLLTQLTFSTFESHRHKLQVSRWNHYYGQPSPTFLDGFIAFWNFKDNTIKVGNRSERLILSNFFNKQPTFI